MHCFCWVSFVHFFLGSHILKCIYLIQEYIFHNCLSKPNFHEPLNFITTKKLLKETQFLFPKVNQQFEKTVTPPPLSADLNAPSTNANNQTYKTIVTMEAINSAFSNKNGKANFGILENIGM